MFFTLVYVLLVIESEFMSEIPKGTQFVGQADARAAASRESVKKADINISQEQQCVVDTMAEGEKVVAEKVLSASEEAGQKLQKLQGKELVNAGLRQMGHGAWETFKSELKWGIGGALAGGGILAAVGMARGVDFETALLPVSMGAGIGGSVGGLIGYETAGLKYNKKVAPKNDLPKTEWYDWVTGNASYLGLNALARGRVSTLPGAAALVVTSFFTNPISMGGLRNVATGLWQMRKG